MALLSQQLQRFLLTNFIDCPSFKSNSTRSTTSVPPTLKPRTRTCSGAIAIDAQSSPLADVAGVRWGSTSLQGPREEMEDDVVLRSDGLDGFSFAAVFDGHGGSASVKFLRDELYKECCTALQGGLLLTEKHFNTISDALQEAFQKADQKLLNWLELNGEDDESGSTATVILVGNDMMFVSHIGDSCVVLSRSGKVEVLSDPHRPYGSNKVSLQEIKRIREAGGWIVNGRICGDIAVSRAFGDQRFKTKKNEMLKKGVEEGRWTEKFVSRSEAVDFVRNQLRQHGDVQLASEKLADAALDRRTQDNVSIVIADLGQTDWRNLPLQEQNFFLELGQAVATLGIVSLGVWMTTLLSS
ncbi:hypothetical protein G4B88_023646 [Cannabis sativa]|uniref:protein-serine/threonine phosphatase n=1 Tax=Cannabis sativa TaxID=3483 RepID=A0A7J6HV10_CANSA|nr:hypothetical protein G4B88_023646 [Cannabis sativa]